MSFTPNPVFDPVGAAHQAAADERPTVPFRGVNYRISPFVDGDLPAWLAEYADASTASLHAVVRVCQGLMVREDRERFTKLVRDFDAGVTVKELLPVMEAAIRAATGFRQPGPQG